jgi:hypothetical protein
MSAFPPIRTHPSIPISTEAALKRLQSYLSAIQHTPYLLPNATLQPDGPRAQSESASNLVIHNLKRVEAGLRGEWLAPSLDLETAADETGGLNAEISIGGGGGGYGRSGGHATGQDEAEGWQDLDEYQREQSIEIGEVGPRETGIGQEGEEAVQMEIEVLGKGARKALDKEEKRRRKKEKMMQEKKERHKKRAEGGK